MHFSEDFYLRSDMFCLNSLLGVHIQFHYIFVLAYTIAVFHKNDVPALLCVGVKLGLSSSGKEHRDDNSTKMKTVPSCGECSVCLSRSSIIMKG
jgi:hypothetical protein